MTSLLGSLRETGYLSPLDWYFARDVARLGGDERELVQLAMALTSRQTRQGHVCADLRQISGQRPIGSEGELASSEPLPDVDSWLRVLCDSPCVVHLAAGDTANHRAPLVLDPKGRLYLYRYWEHERTLARRLVERLEPARNAQTAVDPRIEQDLDDLFGKSDSGEPDRQRLAARTALRQDFLVISGGPGTGKTSTVIKLLALLLLDARRRGVRRFRSLLLAPTGKAAARLVESVRRAKERLAFDDELSALIPEHAATIHRALGVRPGSTRFRHDRENPLRAELVLVDEASMVDIALMRRLLEAVPRGSKLILLGDRHQLASVEAGAVLGDVCAAPAVSERAVVELSKSYRFGADSGIAAVARAVRDGDDEAALRELGGVRKDIELVRAEGGRDLPRSLLRGAVDWFRAVRSADEPAAALARLDAFRILCAHRRGLVGVVAVNRRIEQELEHAGIIAKQGDFYVGRPVLVTQNDYGLQLYNCDVGITIGADGGALRVAFPSEGGVRTVAPARLPPHETVFAMSIHKSQGSEFDHVAIVLPDETSPLLTRELLYTAVTRARTKATLYGTPAAIAKAVAQPVQRASGLGDAIADLVNPA